MNLKSSNGYLYAEELPKRVNKVTFKTGVELLRLQKGKKKWTAGNLELRDGLPLFIYSPFSNKYWYRKLALSHDRSEYRKFIKEGNLYIAWDEEWEEITKQEREQEGMSYHDYNKFRELTLLKEYQLTLPDQTLIRTKIRAIEIQQQLILKKYEQA
jgi:hypothetical protein